MPLSATESALLRRLGIQFLHLLTNVSIYCFAYGIFTLLFWKSIAMFIRRGFSTRATRIMFGTTVVNFILFGIIVGASISTFIIFIRKALIDLGDVPLVQRPPIVNEMISVSVRIHAWAINLTRLVSDPIVIWRAWVLFQDQKWILVLPMVLWLGAFGTILTYLVLILIDTASFQSSVPSQPGAFLFFFGLILSVATNAVTTIMIGYKLWTHRRMLVKHLGLRGRKSPVQKVLILLVESGLVYCVVQAIYLGFDLRLDPESLMFFLFDTLYASLAAMYPTIVIILVESHRSAADVCGLTNPSFTPSAIQSPPEADMRTATFGHLSFAAAERTTTETSSYAQTIEESQSRREHSHEKGVEFFGKPEEGPRQIV